MSAGPRRPDLAAELICRAAEADEHWHRLVRVSLPDQQVGQGRHTDYLNAGYLKRIIEDYGWPDVQLVGDDGAEAAWQIALRADIRKDVQLSAARLMYAAVQQGTASSRLWAHLHDRYRLNIGSPQVYGTQYRRLLGPHGPERADVHEPEGLDARRAQMDLPPAAEALERLRRRLAEDPPAVHRPGAAAGGADLAEAA
ncbi:DUF6624 domain-containing protein [Streptomyces sp. PTY087I2]|uniref:DUF6624 domain-containing protein n=1 Tax=Streptomyces sp. PTY087I2 TaxID=1819298 RepID=UPI00080AFEF0|nr:DUF6624 domain-containing protein [Streptomyces sp. PTY087I2]OCC13992.1 hypothetical protein A3Q37_00264 [Streptomyces sp. PTY087I2]